MKRLHLSYEMLIEYSVEVSKCYFTIKCIPVDSLRQKISNIQIHLIPDVRYSYGKDGLNNVQIYGVNEIPHKFFKFSIEADAETGLSDYESDTNEDLDMIFGHPHGLNIAGKKIKNFYQINKDLENITNPYDKAMAIMHKLSNSFDYVPLSTDVNTSAEQAFEQGHGVCQDYAHIYIALLHLAGIRARYVTGFIVGEGASHAWVEVLVNDKWFGFDPTHDRLVDDEYIKLGIGRDAKDCMINRGIMHGGGLHTQKVAVYVNEEE